MPSSKFAAKTSDGMGHFSGANIDGDNGGIGADIAEGSHNRRIKSGHGLQHRYQDDLDTIEVCLEQEPASIQPGIISPVAATGRSFGTSRAIDSGGAGNNCNMRSNMSQGSNTPAMTPVAGTSQVNA